MSIRNKSQGGERSCEQTVQHHRGDAFALRDTELRQSLEQHKN